MCFKSLKLVRIKERNKERKKERKKNVCVKMFSELRLAIRHEPRRDMRVIVATLSFVIPKLLL